MLARALALLAAALVFACSSGDPIDREDQGNVCADVPGRDTGPFLPAAGPRVLPADRAVEISVSSSGCLSSSCDVDRVASCSVELSGATLTVTSRHAWTANARSECTDDCGSLVARCATPALAAGVYTIVHGTRTATIVVGGADNPACPDIPG